MWSALVLGILAAGSAAGEYADFVYVAPETTGKSAASAAMPRDAVQAWLQQDYPSRVFTAFEAKNGELAANAENPSLEVASGFPLDLNTEDLFGAGFQEGDEWVFLAGITSLDAHALRLLVDLSGLQAGDELWLLSPSGPGAHGPFAAAQTAQWLPTVEGDTAVLMLRTAAPAPPSLRLQGLSHFFVPLGAQAKATPCPTPVACETSSAGQKVSTGIAMLIIPSGLGQFQCTGALINNPATADTLESLILSANHCFSGEVDATQVDVIWDYRAENCAGENPPALADVPRSTGESILAQDSVLDGAFLQLSGAVPNGTYGRAWLGWDTRTPVLNDQVVVLHHPSGTPMKISYGHVTAVSVNSCLDVLCSHPVKYQTEAHWDAGITESGSSGSPLLFANVNYRVCGMLSNGNAQTCGAAAYNYDNFSSFRDFFAEIACHLTPATPCSDPLPTSACPAKSAFGPGSSEVAQLRSFRDKRLMGSASGRFVAGLYYQAAPAMARTVERSPLAREVFKAAAMPFVALGARAE